ncbi:MAG: hypothetical protein JXB30_10515 [Anaerolineae bacterium]|nr:hypothetical protein [Anaerolineae bacterium]
MGMWDLIFVGTPLLGGVILLAGSIYEGIRYRHWLFVIPAVAGLVASCDLSGMVIAPELDSTGLSCTSAFFWLALGIFAYIVIRCRRIRPDASPPGNLDRSWELTDENP